VAGYDSSGSVIGIAEATFGNGQTSLAVPASYLSDCWHQYRSKRKSLAAQQGQGGRSKAPMLGRSGKGDADPIT